MHEVRRPLEEDEVLLDPLSGSLWFVFAYSTWCKSQTQGSKLSFVFDFFLVQGFVGGSMFRPENQALGRPGCGTSKLMRMALW